MRSPIPSFAKAASSVKHDRRIVRRCTRSDIAEINKVMEPKLCQNQRERVASMSAAVHCVVGGK